jgi:hypothetical protein
MVKTTEKRRRRKKKKKKRGERKRTKRDRPAFIRLCTSVYTQGYPNLSFKQPLTISRYLVLFSSFIAFVLLATFLSVSPSLSLPRRGRLLPRAKKNPDQSLKERRIKAWKKY